MDGGAGNDTYNGWRGNDTYHIDDAGDRILFYDVIDFIPAEDQGVDRVLATVSVDLQVFIDINNERYVDDGFLTRSGIEYITLKGTADIDAAGDAGDNIITGNPGKNVLQGRGGNDILDGKSGGDLMIGGTGDDQYFVDNGNDRVIELAGEGNDTVTSKVNFSLAGQYIETLILAGNASVGTGNSQANSIYGNEGSDTLYGLGGNDRLDGGVGADTMYGGTGDDSYWIDDAGDQFIELANEGTDIVYAAKNVSLMNTHVENAQLLGVAPWSGNGGWAIGNGLANTLTGSAYNDVLNGKLGSDTLFGGAGADIFAFDTALGSTNVDTIGDFVSGEDRIRLNDSVFVGLAAVRNAQFRLGTAAVDSDDRIIYDSGTGNILFDVDGNGGQAAQLFAVLVGGVALIASDFFMA